MGASTYTSANGTAISTPIHRRYGTTPDGTRGGRTCGPADSPEISTDATAAYAVLGARCSRKTTGKTC